MSWGNLIAGYIGLQFILVLVIVLLSWLIWDKRFQNKSKQDVPQGFVWTEEVSFDPTTGKRLRVYYQPDTGERFYKEEVE